MSDATRFGMPPVPAPDVPPEEPSELSGIRFELARWLALLDAKVDARLESLEREVTELRKGDEA